MEFVAVGWGEGGGLVAVLGGGTLMLTLPVVEVAEAARVLVAAARVEAALTVAASAVALRATWVAE